MAQAADLKIIVIGGPTASGKSALGLSLAKALNGCIINADSVQLYDALHALAAQPDAEEQSQAPHKLYGILHPNTVCSAASWRDMAITEINAAHARGEVPIIIGGTGFYLNTLIKGLSPIPDIPDDLRARTIAHHDAIGTDALFAELQERDPETSAKLDPKNKQRLMRAWEVLEHTGKSLSYWQAQPMTGTPDHFKFVTCALLPPREYLYERCNLRFDLMLEQGAMAEAEKLYAQIQAGEVDAKATITKATGYIELAKYISGEWDLDTAIEKGKQHTRNYAKKQMTWLRGQLPHDVILESGDQYQTLIDLYKAKS